MASSILHWFEQLNKTGEIKIFENSKNYFRDFIWVEDVAKTIYHFMYNNYQPGIYDLGSGNRVDFETIADTIIDHTGSGTKKFIDMPADLKNQYQINTLADTNLLISSGVDVENFIQINAGIEKYIKYLSNMRYI
jgi:ADP-L-glycero-D-manno-heptose 6-epimerase